MNAPIRYRITALTDLQVRADVWDNGAEPTHWVFSMLRDESRDDIALVLGVSEPWQSQNDVLIVHPKGGVGHRSQAGDFLRIERIA